jgi:hemolysin activation/secretion protein
VIPFEAGSASIVPAAATSRLTYHSRVLEPRPRTKSLRAQWPRAGRTAHAAGAVVILALAAPIARAAEVGTPPSPVALEASSVPDDAVLEAGGAIVGRIDVVVGNVFDPSQPGENNPIFRAANFVHIRTKESVIRRRLLFKEGDRYSRRVLDESERLLRSFGFLYDARIRPVRYGDGKVDVRVETRDVWTLTLGFSFGRKGGVNRVSIGIEERNLLGFGKRLAVYRTSDVDRVTQSYSYSDPSVLGSRTQLGLLYANNSDGFERAATVERPFYSLDARWAAGVSFDQGERVDPLYDMGHVTSRFRHRFDIASAYAGFSRGLVGGRARRLSAGFTFDRHDFALVPGEIPPPELPADRTLAYPWIAFDSVQDGFITTRDLDKIERTEDLNLAHEGHAKLGWAATAFGSDRGRALFEGSYQIGIGQHAGQMVLATAGIAGRHAGDGFENVQAGTSVRAFLRDFGRHLFYASLRADLAYRLDGEDQLLLGGDNGLRGYPLRYQDGDRRFLLTLEQRFYTDLHVFKLFRVGGAVYFDAGRAWFAADPGRPDMGVLRDVGFGLRVQSSRSAKASMAHFDLAFPLDGDPTIERIQFLVSTHETF